MSVDFTLQAKNREQQGKGASRRLRRLAGEVPAIVYGGTEAPTAVSLSHKDLTKALENEAFYSSVVTLDVDGNKQSVILRDLQRHPAKPLIVHADFQRVDADKAIHVNVPLHFINEKSCHGVKIGGGMIVHAATELEVSCLPKDLPEFIEVDMKDVQVGQSIHISEITLPAGVESVALSHGADHDLAIATVNPPKGGASDDAEAGAADDE